MRLITHASKGKRVVRKLGTFLLLSVLMLIVGWFVLRSIEGPWAITGWGFFLGAAIGVKEGIVTWMNYFFGDRGEEELIKKLELLGDEYTVIANWQPPNEKRGDVDLIVLGPHGVAALECKRYSIDFGCDGDFWYQKMENGYKKRIKSLSSQTRGHVLCIKRHLKRQGVTAEVHGVLVFRSLRRACIENAKTRVIDMEDAVDFIYSLPRTGEVGPEYFSGNS